MNAADFRSLLLAAAGVEDLVGARVFPVKIPEETWDSVTQRPCLVYHTPSVRRSATFCGTVKTKADTVHVDCYARTYDGARALALAVAGIVDFKGVVGETLFGPIFIDSETDLDDPEPGLFRRLLIFTVWNRSTAT